MQFKDVESRELPWTGSAYDWYWLEERAGSNSATTLDTTGAPACQLAFRAAGPDHRAECEAVAAAALSHLIKAVGPYAYLFVADTVLMPASPVRRHKGALDGYTPLARLPRIDDQWSTDDGLLSRLAVVALPEGDCVPAVHPLLLAEVRFIAASPSPLSPEWLMDMARASMATRYKSAPRAYISYAKMLPSLLVGNVSVLRCFQRRDDSPDVWWHVQMIGTPERCEAARQALSDFTRDFDQRLGA